MISLIKAGKILRGWFQLARPLHISHKSSVLIEIFLWASPTVKSFHIPEQSSETARRFHPKDWPGDKVVDNTTGASKVVQSALLGPVAPLVEKPFEIFSGSIQSKHQLLVLSLLNVRISVELSASN